MIVDHTNITMPDGTLRFILESLEDSRAERHFTVYYRPVAEIPDIQWTTPFPDLR